MLKPTPQLAQTHNQYAELAGKPLPDLQAKATAEVQKAMQGDVDADIGLVRCAQDFINYYTRSELIISTNDRYQAVRAAQALNYG